jgi:ferric-dicitrate binding protein FerR (iron transport regulator)
MNQLDQAVFEIAHEQISGKQVDSAAARVRQGLFGASASGADASPAANQRLRTCSDFQALIPAYLNRSLSAGRALLLQDHTRECVACRHALQNARSGAPPMLMRPVTPPTRTISRVWAMAAAATITVGLTGWLVSRTLFPQATGPVAVQTVSGILYAVSDHGSTAIFAGHKISTGEHVRTAKDSTAVLRLGDGSLVEMNARAELSVVPGLRGSSVHLDRGDIIVQAAKQRTGTLDILTSDCTVSVKGTIFAVNRGTKGTRVSVVQGAVKVAQGAQSQMLKPGDQVTTDSSLTATPVSEEVAWSRDSARYVTLLNEFNAIKKGIDALPSPGLRYHSKLLPLVSGDTVLYAAIPNVATTLGEAQKLFNERLQKSDVLRQWWQEQQDGPKMQQMVDTLRRFSEYLGDEIVLTVEADRGHANYSAPLIMAEVRVPGLEGFVSTELQALGQQGHNGLPQIVHLDSMPQPNGANRRRRRTESGSIEGPMLIGLKDNLMVIGWSPDQLAEVAQRAVEQPGPGGNRLAQNVEAEYQNGAGWLMCVNMEHIARNLVHSGGSESPRLPKGLDGMRYLIVERKDVSGKVDNTATLTFEGGRRGIADWLAEPSPMGSLDFVSPNATVAVSMALRNPSRMLSELFTTLSEQDPKFQEELQSFTRHSTVAITPSLAEPLGGEFTFAIDGPLLPLPSWKFAVEVYSPDRLQWAIEQFVNATKGEDAEVTLSKEQSSGRTVYTLTSSKVSYEIDYVYVDGYLVAAPSRALLNQALQNRSTGYVLSRSETFRSQLPKDGRLNFSALFYHNVGTAIAPFARQAGAPQIALAPGLVYAYGEPDRIIVATGGTFFGLDINALALPNLIHLGRPGSLRQRVN